MKDKSLSDQKTTQGLLRPVERIAINQQILSRLKAFLDQEHLKVGSKLPAERQLAGMLNVSRPSLREVLRALNILGIVKSKQGDGTYLASSLRKALSRPDQILTLQESLNLVELAEARCAVEPCVAALAAVRASAEDLRNIGKELQGMRKNLTNREQFLSHDLQFHLRIMKSCGNEVLKRMMLVVLETLFEHGAQVAQHYRDLSNVLALHHDIFDALSQGNPRAARAAMIRHMRVSKKENARVPRQMAPARPKDTTTPERLRQALRSPPHQIPIYN